MYRIPLNQYDNKKSKVHQVRANRMKGHLKEWMKGVEEIMCQWPKDPKKVARTNNTEAHHSLIDQRTLDNKTLIMWTG